MSNDLSYPLVDNPGAAELDHDRVRSAVSRLIGVGLVVEHGVPEGERVEMARQVAQMLGLVESPPPANPTRTHDDHVRVPGVRLGIGDVMETLSVKEAGRQVELLDISVISGKWRVQNVEHPLLPDRVGAEMELSEVTLMKAWRRVREGVGGRG